MRHLFLPIGFILGLVGCAASTNPSVAAAPPENASVAGTRWMAPEGSDNTRPRLEFIGENRVSGYTGCNMLSGSWREEGGVVRFGLIAITKRGCMGPEGEVEKKVLAALAGDSTAKRSGNRLTVTSPSGASFEFVSTPTPASGAR